jgi:uncharacterized membrane protein
MTIRNPVVWTWDQVKLAVANLDEAGHRDVGEAARTARPMVRRIDLTDIRDALSRGIEDFNTDPTHYLFLCALYPVIGLVLARFASGAGVLPLIFPLVAGFALLGPLAGIGIYEMSMRRERGEDIAWWNAFYVVRSPALGQIVKLGLLLAVIFVVWLVVAYAIYWLTLRTPPVSAAEFLHAVFTTKAGWALIVVGNFVGFLFALLVLMISVVSFPLILDRHVTAEVAIQASVRAVLTSPGTMAIWGLVIAGGLVLGSIPLLLGLALVFPVLGHASWHLYRRVVLP